MLELYLRGRSMRIIEFLKRLFHREKPIEIKQKKYLNPPKKMKQKKDLNPPKKMKQTYVAKSTNYLDEQYELFQTIQPGYLVFCRMPVCEDNLVDINHPHRIRPYLIIKKDKDYLYGYAGSTKKKNPKIQYTLKDGHKDKETGAFSDSYLYLNNVYRIPIQNIKGILKQVSSKDLIQIQRKIQLLKNSDVHHIVLFENIDFEFEVGDIVTYNTSLYFVSKVEDNKIFGYVCSNTNGDIELKGLNLFINTDIERKIEPNPHSLKYIFNTNVNRYVNKQLKKENKEVLKLKEDVYVSRNVQYYNYYPLGTILRDINTDEEIVYLFNYRKRPYCARLEEMYNDNYSIWQYSPKYYCVEDELTENGMKEMLEGFLSKKSRNKEINKPFIPIFEIEYKKIKKV